ncbi:hypothetical protein CLV30_11495 [Haloactinopolyspora alba]|uniref:Uncharacterized protein n=1 Tax=Haloactinopolyspora alba TaxID=648780 RepID=A0A2P8DVX9_9ACTN|nr:hypothetical protein [Haloactinopolyspora alba]PSL01365.1 hypothetical protein CLV30_11495 [Haloactinopolyspora alba]
MNDESTRTERLSTGQLVLAAAALAVLGLMLIFGFGSSGEAGEAGTGETAAQPRAATDDDTDAGEHDSAPESQDSPTPADSASPTSSSRPPLTPPPGIERPGPTQAPEPSTVDETSPSQLALAAVTAAYSMDSTTDADPEEALRRAEPWLAEPYDADVYDLERLGEDVEDDWDTWAEHDAYASINTIQDVISNDQTAPAERGDTATTAMRKIAVSFTPLGRDGWNGSVSDDTWYVHLERQSKSDPWHITEMRRPEFSPTFQPLPTGTPS